MFLKTPRKKSLRRQAKAMNIYHFNAMKTIKIMLKRPHSALSPNGNRAHWAVLSRERKKAHRAAYAAMRVELTLAAQHQETWTFQPTCYRLIWYYKGCRPDDDNCLARVKAHKDGACEAMGIDDKTLSLTGIKLVYDKSRAGSFELEFKERTEI